MSFCENCGLEIQIKESYCGNCGNKIEIRVSQKNTTFVGKLTHGVTNKLELDDIQSFSIKELFSNALKRHSQDEVESALSVGTISTTPHLEESMTILPHPWMFSKFLFIYVTAFMIFLFLWNITENLNLIPALIMIGSFAVPISMVVFFFELNTPKNISIYKTIYAVFIGGAVAILFTLALYLITGLDGLLGPLGVGIIEELGKFAGVLFIMKKMGQKRYPYLLNALLLGAAVGAGFAAFESAGYAFNALYDLKHPETLNFGMMFLNLFLRGFLSPFAHILWTAIAAAAFWMMREKRKLKDYSVNSRNPMRLLLLSIGLHFLWDLDFMEFMIKDIALGVIAWIAVISIIQLGLKQIKIIIDYQKEGVL
ncbi:PrsW family intramembrane metalloprotease [Polynucleobacter sp. MWH-Creno-3A4]|uniref:PrsW family intramembrane metalloprotease n=1 Tax=Polynucleobacter sp. MWH-Creno-3A4 TaxID=1855886 RepID=UPI001C0D1EDC|nr:PrsW family intramembrane metalloprotease [Polynucleobacter sp. MWH-Creno-3A4]MBU3606805.1 PrsW family intramembrane metalloprotease [Polynucleobacter sp. MWH-Creno-3A4]